MTDSKDKNKECIELFCRTVAELNSISLRQLEGLLGLAADAVKKADRNEPAGEAAQYVEELKKTAEEISRQARTQEAELFENVKKSLDGETEEYFCAAVEEKLITAMENSLANQQQLNTLGSAIAAQGATLILNSGGSAA